MTEAAARAWPDSQTLRRREGTGEGGLWGEGWDPQKPYRACSLSPDPAVTFWLDFSAALAGHKVLLPSLDSGP